MQAQKINQIILCQYVYGLKLLIISKKHFSARRTVILQRPRTPPLGFMARFSLRLCSQLLSYNGRQRFLYPSHRDHNCPSSRAMQTFVAHMGCFISGPAAELLLLVQYSNYLVKTAYQGRNGRTFLSPPSDAFISSGSLSQFGA